MGVQKSFVTANARRAARLPECSFKRALTVFVNK